jgi:uncharacterized protein YkwD
MCVDVTTGRYGRMIRMPERDRPTVGRRALLRRAGASLVVAVTAGCSTAGDDQWTPTPTPTPYPPPSASGKPMVEFDASKHEDYPEVEPFEQHIHRLTNRARENGGLEPSHDFEEAPPLEFNEDLAYIARTHSQDMVFYDYTGHEDSDGERVFGRVSEYNIKYRSLSENVAGTVMDSGETPEEHARVVVGGWLRSEPHRENLLREKWDYEGIGVFIEEDGGVATTQILLQSRNSED